MTDCNTAGHAEVSSYVTCQPSSRCVWLLAEHTAVLCPCYPMLCHAVPCFAMLSSCCVCVVPCCPHAVLCFAVLPHGVSALCHAVLILCLRCAMLSSYCVCAVPCCGHALPVLRPCCAMLCHAVPWYAMLCPALLRCHPVPCCAVLRCAHAVPHVVKLSHAFPCCAHAAPCFAMLYPMLCWVSVPGMPACRDSRRCPRRRDTQAAGRGTEILAAQYFDCHHRERGAFRASNHPERAAP